METVAEKPAFRRAFAAAGACCRLMALRVVRRTQGRQAPYFIHPKDGGVLAMAGLYEIWRDSTRDPDDPRAWLWTATCSRRPHRTISGGSMTGRRCWSNRTGMPSGSTPHQRPGQAA
jgi:hypothetical protein